MKRFFGQLVLAWLVACAGVWAQTPDAPVAGTITATRLNVRARPGTQYEVVCQLLRDAAVQVVAREGEWVGIALDEPEGKNAGTIKGVVDGDFCQTYLRLSPDEQRQVAEELDRTPAEVAKKLEELASRIL